MFAALWQNGEEMLKALQVQLPPRWELVEDGSECLLQTARRLILPPLLNRNDDCASLPNIPARSQLQINQPPHKTKDPRNRLGGPKYVRLLFKQLFAARAIRLGLRSLLLR